MKKIVTAVFLSLLFPAAGFAIDYGALFQKAGINKQTKLSDTKIGAGLKEALKVGVDRTVQTAGKKDGYFSNQAVKISMPEKIKTLEPMLRKLGMNSQMDNFVLSMNRAAEKAAPAAKNIFIDAITDMSIDDVQKIYNGGDTAATQYFQSKTTAKLAEAYKPIIQKAMGDYAVTKQYQVLMNKVPLAKNFNTLNIENHVLDKALSGLFRILGEQEKAIRQDPAARATALLKEVFSKTAATL